MSRRPRGTQEVTQVGAADTVVLPANPNRRRILVSNGGPGAVYLSMGRPATGPIGIFLPPVVDPMDLGDDVWGSLPGMELHALATVYGTGTGIQTFISQTVSVHNASTAALGTILSYTCPAGKNAICTEANWFNTAVGGQALQFKYTPNGGQTVTIKNNYGGDIPLFPDLPLAAGDAVLAVVSIAAAGSTADAVFGIQEYTTVSGSSGTATAVLTIWTAEDCGMRN